MSTCKIGGTEDSISKLWARVRTLDCKAPVIATVSSPLETDVVVGENGVGEEDVFDEEGVVGEDSGVDGEGIIGEEDVVGGEDGVGEDSGVGKDGGDDSDLFLPSVGCRSFILG